MARQTKRLELTIHELAAGGDGVAIADVDGERRAIFLPFVATGERVEAEVDLATRPARGRVLQRLSASPSRVEPACPDVARCGACDWMHLAPDAQRAAHVAIVERALVAAFPGAKAIDHAVPGAVGYRARARVHAAIVRGRIDVGMFGKNSRDPVPVARCVVLAPPVERVRTSLASLLQGAKGKGDAQISLGKPGPDRRAVVELRWHGELPAAFFGRLEKAIGVALDGARVFDGDVKVPAVVGDPTPWIAGADDIPLRLGPGGFSQASEAGNAALARHVQRVVAELLPDPSALKAPVLELYAGAGNLTVLLAATHRVVAVEDDADACAAARLNLGARGGAAAEAKVVQADARTFAIPRATPLVVLDPPRTGAREVVAELARKPVPAVVYVSCDPPTLGRDLAVLASAGYALRSLDTFEMFPQTSHVESVAVLTHTRKGQG